MSLGIVSLVAWPPSSTYSRGGQKGGTALVPLAVFPRRFSTNPVGAHPNPQVDTDTNRAVLTLRTSKNYHSKFLHAHLLTARTIPELDASLPKDGERGT
ncbi:hypothetical protein NA56DRAFT_712339 [Hyaloscypha hepaticicola]|uniref:Uncharacterized protein n=1 Tax=Hyaloscypha hepaticicola TaxID=2082293 RepID=A0A2J6PGI0_9HELO|nr:hypothetical protein NA56DRAFT_712339 [Hyaloscypha hepaticicola]